MPRGRKGLSEQANRVSHRPLKSMKSPFKHRNSLLYCNLLALQLLVHLHPQRSKIKQEAGSSTLDFISRMCLPPGQDIVKVWNLISIQKIVRFMG